MPKIKFEPRQLTLLRDSLKLRYEHELDAYYQILCNALGTCEGFARDSNSFDTGIFLVKKKEAIAIHERLRDIHQARISLFEAEYRGETVLTEDAETYLNETKGKRAIEEGIIYGINEKFDLLKELQILLKSIEKKNTEKEPHPLSDYDGNGRLNSPTDTLI